MGFFRKRSDKDELAELNAKIKAESARAAAYSKKNQLKKEIERKRQTLAKLKKIKEPNLYQKIKKKTSPAIRGFEKKALPKIKKSFNKLGKASAQASGLDKSGYSLWDGPSGSKKKKEKKVRLW